MTKHKKFGEWLSVREDINSPQPPNTQTPNAQTPMQNNQFNTQIATVAANIAKRMKLVPGTLNPNQTSQILRDPEVAKLGNNASGVIQILNGNKNMQKPGIQ